MRDVWVVWVVICASGCGTGASDDTPTDETDTVAEETGTDTDTGTPDTGTPDTDTPDTPIDPGPIVGTWDLAQADLTLYPHERTYQGPYGTDSWTTTASLSVTSSLEGVLRVDVAQSISDYAGTTTSFDEYPVSGTYDGVSYRLVEAGAGGWDVTCTVAGAVLTCDANAAAEGGMPRSALRFRFER